MNRGMEGVDRRPQILAHAPELKLDGEGIVVTAPVGGELGTQVSTPQLPGGYPGKVGANYRCRTSTLYDLKAHRTSPRTLVFYRNWLLWNFGLTPVQGSGGLAAGWARYRHFVQVRLGRKDDVAAVTAEFAGQEIGSLLGEHVRNPSVSRKLRMSSPPGPQCVVVPIADWPLKPVKFANCTPFGRAGEITFDVLDQSKVPGNFASFELQSQCADPGGTANDSLS